MKKQIIGNSQIFFFFVDFVCVCVVGFLVGCGLFFVLVVKINTATDLTVIQVSTRQLAASSHFSKWLLPTTFTISLQA